MLRKFICFSPEGDAGGSGDATAKLAALEAKNVELLKQIEEFKKASTPHAKDETLNDKVKADEAAKEATEKANSELSSAIKFNLLSEKFLKENKSILPKECEAIFAAAEKEKYASDVEKSNATKSALIQSFFSLQENVDALTASQKADVQEYLKLTKLAKEQRADSTFKSIFEPTVEMMKKIKKAEEAARSRNGYVEGSDLEENYKKRLIELSTKNYLGGK